MPETPVTAKTRDQRDIGLAIMVGGAIGIIITLFDPVRRDAMLGLWRQATVWLFAN